MNQGKRGRRKQAGFSEQGAAYSAPAADAPAVQVVELGAGGRIVIPAAMRAALGMKVGDRLSVRIEDGELRIATARAVIRRIQERMRPYLPENAVDEFLKWKREEAARELADMERGYKDE